MHTWRLLRWCSDPLQPFNCLQDSYPFSQPKPRRPRHNSHMLDGSTTREVSRHLSFCEPPPRDIQDGGHGSAMRGSTLTPLWISSSPPSAITSLHIVSPRQDTWEAAEVSFWGQPYRPCCIKPSLSHTSSPSAQHGPHLCVFLKCKLMASAQIRTTIKTDL